MAWDALTDAETAAGQAVTQPLMRKLKDNFDYLYGESGSKDQPPNGSFEIDSDADDTADQWSQSAYSGGTITRDATAGVHATACMKMIHPGGASNGGGYAESDYVSCSDVRQFLVGWTIWCSAAGMKNQVVLRFFDEAKVDLSADDTVYSSTATPTSETIMSARVTPPTDAHFCKIKLIGGFTDTDSAGTTYFDDVWLKEGVFNVVELTGSGSFVAPAADLLITGCGAGAGGGAADTNYGGNGGNSGCYVENYHYQATAGESISYSVPASGGATGTAGGNTTFGDLTIPGGPAGLAGGNAQPLGMYRSVDNGYTSGGVGNTSGGSGNSGGNSLQYTGGTGGGGSSGGGGGAASEYANGGNGSNTPYGTGATGGIGAGGGGGGLLSGAGGPGGAGKLFAIWIS